MQNRDFEKAVQGKMEELKLAPGAAVWDKIAAGLPEKKPRRRIFIFFLFTALLIFSGLTVFLNKQDTHKENKPVITTLSALKTDTAVASVKEENKNFRVIENTEKKLTKNEAAEAVTKTGKQSIAISADAAAKIKYKQPVATIQDVNSEATFADDNILKTVKGKIRTKITAPAATNDAAVIINDETAAEGQLLRNRLNEPLSGSAIRTKPQLQNVLAKPLFTFVSTPLNEQAKVEKKNNKYKWYYGVLAAGGKSAANNKFPNNSFYNNSPVFTTGPGSIAVQRTAGINNPQTNVGWQFGFYAQKKINERWRFFTAFNYARQANSIRVGQKVDTAISVNYDLNKSFETTNYYQLGSNVKYINNYHLLELPVAMHYRISKKLPLYAEAGAAPGVLLSSNALVYSNASQSYVTNPAVFNKIILSVNAGAVIDVNAKKQFPFSIGYSFRYGVTSVVKSSFGKQHFTNSMLYVKIPFKK